jgi:hypothetical protein
MNALRGREAKSNRALGGECGVQAHNGVGDEVADFSGASSGGEGVG